MVTLLEKLMLEVRSKIKEIRKLELMSAISLKKDIVVLDVRSKSDWEKSHLPGAINCERGVLEIKIEKLVPNINQETIVYCGGGTRSALVAESLQRMGYTKVQSLNGGFRGWVNEKLPVEKS